MLTIFQDGPTWVQMGTYGPNLNIYKVVRFPAWVYNVFIYNKGFCRFPDDTFFKRKLGRSVPCVKFCFEKNHDLFKRMILNIARGTTDPGYSI